MSGSADWFLISADEKPKKIKQFLLKFKTQQPPNVCRVLLSQISAAAFYFVFVLFWRGRGAGGDGFNLCIAFFAFLVVFSVPRHHFCSFFLFVPLVFFTELGSVPAGE